MIQTFEALKDQHLDAAEDPQSPWWDRCARCGTSRMAHNQRYLRFGGQCDFEPGDPLAKGHNVGPDD